MKLSNKAKEELSDIFSSFKECQQFIKSNDIEVCSKTLPNALSFFDKDHNGITPINKSIGSKLQYMDNAIERLSYFILNNTKRG